MKLPEFNDQGERLVLGHKPVPPYPRVFWGCFVGGLVYLGWIIFSSLLNAGGGH